MKITMRLAILALAATAAACSSHSHPIEPKVADLNPTPASMDIARAETALGGLY